jgi:hypothetical protein
MKLARLFPPTVDHAYAGYRVALWLLGLIVLAKGAMGLNSIFNGHEVATSADGIPLAAFAPAGAAAVVSFLALWGLSQLILSLLGALALVRYRAMVPLVFVLFLFELLGRKLILIFMPIAKSGPSPAFSINAIFLCLMILGLALSLWKRE